MSPTPSSSVGFLAVPAAAEFIGVQPETVRGWMRANRIPYVEHSGLGEQRIPLRGLLATLRDDPALCHGIKLEHEQTGACAPPAPPAKAPTPRTQRHRPRLIFGRT